MKKWTTRILTLVMTLALMAGAIPLNNGVVEAASQTKYSVSYDGNGATSGDMAVTKDIKYGKSFKLSVNKYKKIGYTFVGWSKTKNGKLAYKDKEKVKNLSKKNKATVKLFAKWIDNKKKYTIKYQLNGGTLKKKNKTKYTVKDSFTLNNPTKKNATFAGWYATKDFSGEKITKISKGNFGNKTLYAKWEAMSVKVDITMQKDGVFLLAPQMDAQVKSDLAESYGYEDLVDSKTNVSVLDALVYIHELKYGKSFTKESAKNYLAISDSPYGGTSVDKMMGVTTINCGFALNNSYPQINGLGTTVGTQTIATNDEVEFFFYSDNWQDQINWIVDKNGSYKRELKVNKGKDTELSVLGTAYSNGYLYTDVNDMTSKVNTPMANIKIYKVNMKTGKLSLLGNTDDKGKIVKSFDKDCYIVAKGTVKATSYDGSQVDAPLLLTLTKITVK